MIRITAAATSLALLSQSELRAAVKVSDNSKDAILSSIEVQVAAAIMSECGIASDGEHPPTLLAETVEETIRLHGNFRCGSYGDCDRALLKVSRRPVKSITSIVEAGATLDPTNYELHGADGLILRLSNDCPRSWVSRGKVVVTYVAGYDAPPGDLKMAATMLVQQQYFTIPKDQLLRSERVEGVGWREYWNKPVTSDAIPSDVKSLLRQYQDISIG